MTLAEATRQYQRALEALRCTGTAWDGELEEEVELAREQMERLWVVHEAERICA